MFFLSENYYNYSGGLLEDDIGIISVQIQVGAESVFPDKIVWHEWGSLSIDEEGEAIVEKWHDNNIYGLQPGDRMMTISHLRINLPNNYHAEIRSVSENADKGLDLIAGGIVHPGYNGYLSLAVENKSLVPQPLLPGDIVAHLLVNRDSNIPTEGCSLSKQRGKQNLISIPNKSIEAYGGARLYKHLDRIKAQRKSFHGFMRQRVSNIANPD